MKKESRSKMRLGLTDAMSRSTACGCSCMLYASREGWIMRSMFGTVSRYSDTRWNAVSSGLLLNTCRNDERRKL
jgi:hypothetical protein